MKTAYSECLLIIAAALLLSACASQKPALLKNPNDSHARLLVASADGQDISAKDAALLDPDTFGWEDEDETNYTVADPLEGLNRAMFTVNDKLYFWILKPVAIGYRTVAPQPARIGVKNFFYNLTAPVRIVNNILQGKGEAAEAEVTRFLYNTTVGVLGFGNPAAKVKGLNPDAEDLGQTLGDYGIGNGFYIVWPVFGPSTLRDSVGSLGDWFINPTSYAQPSEVSWGLSGYNRINNLSFHIGDYESLKKAALDPYEAVRNAYIQLRQSRIKN